MVIITSSGVATHLRGSQGSRDACPREQSSQPVLEPRRFEISRWYVLPLVRVVVPRLAATRIRPHHLTLANLALVLIAAAWLALAPTQSPWVALLVLGAWICDRCDGPLARTQGTATRFGAWFDANVDELGDIVLHVALACAAVRTTGSWLPGGLLVAFLAGKYLCMFSLLHEANHAPPTTQTEHSPSSMKNLGRRLYHQAGDADVRLHVLLCVLVSGWFTAGLGYVALYYNVRWIARYGLLAQRERVGSG